MAHLEKYDAYGDQVVYKVVENGEEIGEAHRFTSQDEDNGTFEATFCLHKSDPTHAGHPRRRCVIREFKEKGQALRWLKVKAHSAKGSR